MYSLRAVEQQAQAMLVKARQQADALLAAAQEEAELLKRESRELGRIEGHKEGVKQGTEQGQTAGRKQALDKSAAELATLVKSLSSAAEQVEASRKQLIASANADVCALAVAIARKVVHRAAAGNPAALTDTLSQALKFVVGKNDVRIAVHSSQRKLLDESLPALKLSWPSLKHVEIVGDDAIAPGGSRIYTNHGEVDATLDGMIDRIAAELGSGDV
jgi:flagellar assembly protein FliH